MPLSEPQPGRKPLHNRDIVMEAFYREDGSVIAEGHYVAGAATDDWLFLPRSPR